MPLLEVSEITTHYGLSQVLFDVSLEVEPGEVVALIGRNGVGKTTTMRSIIGLTPPSSGSVLWEGQSITGLPTYEVNRLGIGYVPEDRRIFPDLTTWENLDVGYRPTSSQDEWNLDRVYGLFPELKQLRDRKGGHLSGGQQQMLTIARSLMGNPRLLLLDEPSEGLAPLVVKKLRDQIAQLKTEGLSIVLAEQNLGFILSLADRLYILEKGEVKFHGTPDDLRADDTIIQRYLTV